MKINNIGQNPSFQKTLKATCGIKYNNETQQAKIYRLDTLSDYKILEKASKDDAWNNSNYLDDIFESIEYYINAYNVYEMENKKGEMICISVVEDFDSKRDSLQYIETAPLYAQDNHKNRLYKWIGESMITFLSKIAAKKELLVPYVEDKQSTKNFYYRNCGFDRIDKHAALLPVLKYKSLSEQNENNTGMKIKLTI